MFNKKELNTFRCGRLLATHTVKWKHNLVLSNSQITSDYELIWYGRPNANKSSNYGYQQDESTARQHLKSPWSLLSSSLHSSWSPKRHGHGHEWPPVVLCQLAPLFLRYGCFKIWPWKSKGNIIANVKPDDCICCLEFNRNVCFSFHGNRTLFGLWQISYLAGKI